MAQLSIRKVLIHIIGLIKNYSCPVIGNYEAGTFHFLLEELFSEGSLFLNVWEQYYNLGLYVTLLSKTQAQKTCSK